MEALQFPFSLTTFLLLLFLSYTLFNNYRKPRTRNQVRRSPPGPWKLPLVGNLHQLIVTKQPHRALREMARRHGPIMRLQLGEISAVVISTAELAEEVMKTNDLAFAERPQSLATEVMFYGGKDIIFSPYGDRWRQIRRICVHELLNAKRVRSFHAIREQETWALVGSISSSPGATINLTEKLLALANSITLRTTFRDRTGDEEALVDLTRKVILRLRLDVADLFPSSKWLHGVTGARRKLLKLREEADRIIDKLMSQRRGEPGLKKVEGNDDNLLEVLLRLQQSSGLDAPFTDESIKAIIFDVFVAAIDASAMTAEWCMTEILRHPRVMKKAVGEVREVLKGKKKKKIDQIDIQELRYLKMVIKETLRLHPPGPLLLPRQCREATQVGGYPIPTKTQVIVNAWAIGRDTRYWEDAEEFIPERFEDSSVDFLGGDFQFIPFGAGRRMCPGLSFGLAIVELALALLLYHFDWSLPDGMNPVDIDVTETGPFARKSKDLLLTATPYENLDT